MKELSKLKKIFMFTSVHPWNDTRIFYKEVLSLAKKYNVELHAPSEVTYSNVKNVQIFGLPKWKKRRDRKKIRWELLKRILKSNADIYHFHDPELIFTSLLVKLKGKKVIYDVHENIYQQIKTKDYLSSWRRLSYSLIYKIIEGIFNCFIDYYFLAEYSYQKHYNEKKSEVILNYPIQINLSHKSMISGKIVYIGSWIQKIRGALELVEAAYILKQKKMNFHIFWFGNFEFESNLELEVNQLIKKYDLEQDITFTGKLDYFELLEFITDANVGFSCLHPVKNFLGSYSTKMFEYMMVGVSVVTSNFPLWSDIINKQECGYCVDPLRPEKIADAFESLIKNNKIALEMGENGRKAVEEKYNWKNEEKKLFKLYENLLNK